MTSILGVLRNVDPNTPVSKLSEGIIYDAVNQVVEKWNVDANAVIGLFTAGRTTDKASEFLALAGNSEMAEVEPGSSPEPVTATGGNTVGFPLNTLARSVVGNFVTTAYMTTEKFSQQTDQILIAAAKSLRKKLLKRIFNNAPESFTDKEVYNAGAVTVYPLANGDGFIYNTMDGSFTEDTTVSNYFFSGYAASAISDTNNPFKTLGNQLWKYNGYGEGNQIFIINVDQREKVQSLTSFMKSGDAGVSYGADTDLALAQANIGSMTFIGRIDQYGPVYVWGNQPTGYITALKADPIEPAIKRRTDTAESGLPQGLFIKQYQDFQMNTHYEGWLRVGFGGYNRVGAAVMFLDAVGPYTVPATYA